MITNLATNKLKASKSSRDLVESSKDSDSGIESKFNLDRRDTDKDRGLYLSDDNLDYQGPLSTIVICPKERPESRLKPRPKLRDECRMARGGHMDRRGRGRGGTSLGPRKMEREDSYISRGKFQESLNKSNSDSGHYSSSKHYENDNTKSRNYVLYMVPEDSRISKLLRKLSHEDDIDKFLAITQKLQESLMSPDNNRYIRRSFDMIIDSLLDLLHTSPCLEAKNEISKCIGRAGYTLEQDYKRFMDWIFSIFPKEHDIQVKILLLKSFFETFKLEAENPKLKEFASKLMSQLQNILENTDQPDILMISVDVIISFTDLYPLTFNTHFRDTVDILVGWHIDSNQPQGILKFASQSLQRLKKYWISDIDFSLTLLNQFLEDIELYVDDLLHPSSGRSSPEEIPPSPDDCLKRISSFLKVFNTVLKCLGDQLNPTKSMAIDFCFLIDSYSKILKAITKSMDHSINEDILSSGNESALILLSYLQNKSSSANELLYKYIKKQMECCEIFSDFGIISLFKLISMMLRETSANLPLYIIPILLEPGSIILKSRFSPSGCVQKEVIQIFHNLLNLKNIPLLQEAYRYILGDLEKAYKILVPTLEELCTPNPNPHEETSYSLDQIEKVILFYLHGLSDLANASNSIIAIWALKPSIFELLALKLLPESDQILLFSRGLHFSMVYLLYSLCSRSNHFVSSSDLVNSCDKRSVVCGLLGISLNSRPASSPTSKNLEIILQLLRNLLLQNLTEETKLLLLKWIRELIGYAQPYLENLASTEPFQNLIFTVLNTAHQYASSSVILSVLNNAEQLLLSREIKYKSQLMIHIVEVTKIHLNSNSPAIRNQSSLLLNLVPCSFSLSGLRMESMALGKMNKCYTSEPSPNIKIHLSPELARIAQRHHIARGTCGEIHPLQFRIFMSYLLQNNRTSLDDWLYKIFNSCYPLELANSDNKNNRQFGLLARSDRSVTLMWICWEAAAFCVRNKLRTPLGKALDTLTSIEGALKTFAKEATNFHNLSNHKNDHEITINNENEENQKSLTMHIEENMDEQLRARILLEFVEHLDRACHNASEGCATAMLPTSKPVRTFFHTNKSTCQEWLSRIRMAIIIVALHAGNAPAAIRQGQLLLQSFVDSNNTQSPDFERTLMYVCWALCKLKEPESISGLYSWTKEVSGKKLLWLKAACDYANNRFEMAAENFYRLVSAELALSPLHLSTASSLPNDENSDVLKQPLKNLERDTLVIPFMVDQIIESHKAVNNWTALRKWKERENEIWGEKNGKSNHHFLLNSLDMSYVQAMEEFENNDLEATCQLINWPTEENPLLVNKKSWSVYSLLNQAYSSLTKISLKFKFEKENKLEFNRDLYEKVLNGCMYIADCHIRESLRHPPSEFIQDAILLKHISSGLMKLFKGNNDNDFLNMFDLSKCGKSMNSSLLTQIMWWSQYFSDFEMPKFPENRNLNFLKLDTVKLARKENNFFLAKKLILQSFNSNQKININVNLEEFSQNLLTRENKENTIDIYKLKSLKELGKLLFANDHVETAINIASWSALTASEQLLSNSDPLLNETNSRILINLAKWLQQDAKISESFQSVYLEKLVLWQMNHNDPALFYFMEMQTDANLSPKRSHVIPISDIRIGRLLQLSVNQCPTLAKTWSQFGSWCYRWAHRVVDVAATDPGGQLTEDDRLQVQQLLSENSIINSDLESIYSILSQARAVITEDEIDSLDVINTCEMIETQLQNIPSLNRANSETLSKLVNIWRQVQKRVYRYYELSAIAYFKYLELSGNGETEEPEGCAIITSTLRLLRLIVKYALELQTVLEAGLGATPIQPWKCIIPQLFSRLNHPEPYVRRRISELLCRVAQDAPHLITFPAVVGADSGGVQHLREDMNISSASVRLFSSCLTEQECDPVDGNVTVALNGDDDDDEDDEDCFSNDDSQQNVLKACFLAMVDTLSKQTPEAISQVQLLVRELKRITLLWDELWLGTLVQHHAEINRRLGLLESEINKVDANESLSASEKDILIVEKHRIILQPLIFLLEQLNSISSVTPETPHEIAFQEKFSESINKAIERLKNPINPRKPQESCQPLKQLQTKLQQRAQKRIAYTLKMSDISPSIYALQNTCIAMPGVSTRGGQIISISSVENLIAILPTKTKPKKLVFHGSDGKLYTYLFKGLEDLHLDERIMQFLGIANTMMARSSRGTANYRARHYSVIPLGPRSGLIRWVDGVTPLFSLYKRWQQREAMIAQNKTNSNGLVNQSGTSTNSTNTGNTTTQIPRPSDLFYNKLTPLLKEHGITVENRKEWPLNILRQVLIELMEETPRDLLAKELWCHSINAGDWWETTRHYSCSVAVMSIIGYIIGLGDRHLDNVLVDLTNGEVVHIDYNVCFEKGKTLRVPEKVPFRMTSNIHTALGVTGVEGPFRLACEHVLKVMRRGRETLLTLLEAFVYDPLIDWTLGNEAGYTGAVYGGDPSLTGEARLRRREMERELTLAMFRVRIAEVRSGWTQNRNDLLESLPKLETLLEQWLEAEKRRHYWDDALKERAQLLSIVQEAISYSKNNPPLPNSEPLIVSQHGLLNLSTRWTQFRHARDTREKIRLALTEKIEESDKHLAMFKTALNTVRGPQLSQWLTELNYPIPKDSHMVFDLVKEFLQNAGQSQTIVQCEQSESELGQISQQHITLIRNTFELLSRYGAITSLYPASYINNHRSVCYSRWAQILNNNLSLESCREILGEFHSIFSPERIASAPLNQQLGALSYQLQTSLAEANSRYSKSLERYNNEGLPDTSGRLETAYSEARSALVDMQKTDPSSILSLQCVNITALCALNKRLLIIETAALSAGDCLVDLTSREGDWFLDEMYLVSTLVTELSTNLGLFQSDHSDPQLQLLLRCLQTEHSIYKSLQELNYNFYTIILPEAAKTIQTEEPSVLAMIAQLNEVIASLGLPVTDLLAQLEMHLHYVIMEMPSNHQGVQGLVAMLRKKYELLLTAEERDSSINSPSTEEPLSAGQMLLMGFNGLFEKLHIEGSSLTTVLDSLIFPTSWKKVDHVRDAKKLAAAMLNEATRSVLDDIFLLKRLATIQEFFALCTQMAHRGAFFNDSDRLSKPVRRFTADYIARRFLGVTSHTMALTLCCLLQQIGLNVTMEIESQDIGAESKVSLEELCHKAVENCLKRGRFDSSVLSQASALMSTLETTWRRREVARHLQQELEIHRSSVQRLQLQLTAFHWLHEDALLLHGIALTTIVPLNRPAFMLELRKASASLLALQPRVSEALEQQSTLVTSIGQRLKWAAGANPALNEVLAAFETSVAATAERLNLEQRLAAIARNTCNAIIYHEALRTRTSEALTNDTAFLQMVEQCEQMIHLLGSSVQVNPLEERLVQLLIASDPHALEDPSWLTTKAEPLLSDYETLTSFSKHIETFKENITQSRTNLKSVIHLIRNQLGSHHKLISEVRNLFKSMSKIEDSNLAGLTEYLSQYRSYCESFSNLIKDLHNEDSAVDKIEEYIITTKHILEKTTNIYDGLLKFAETPIENIKNKRPPLTRQESICLSPRKGLPNNLSNNKRDPQTGKAIQERNAYALGVWRRVRMKLEGRDPDSLRRSSTQEQVDFVIREATSLDNLALLYEGWTPWV